LATSKAKPQRNKAATSSAAGVTGTPTEGRTLTFAKQAGVIVGLISGVVGLVFLFFPQFRPERQEPNPNQSARVSGVVSNPRTTRGQFLDYSDQPKTGFTKEQLAIVGASAFARVEIVGYRGKTLTLERQLVDARTGDVIGQARDFTVTPPANSVTHRWWDWVPLRRGRGNYVMVIKLLDEREEAAIACGQSPPFGGLSGFATAKPLHLCEQS
jgi:hypothetical protein